MVSGAKPLRNSDILYSIREYLDFGPFLPYPNHRIFQELRETLGETEFNAFLSWATERAGNHGLYKQEILCGSINSEILLFYPVRQKCYFTIVHVENEGQEPFNWYKACSKGPILKSRVKQYQLADYVEMSESTTPKFELDLRKIQSKSWRLYFSSITRRCPNKFERKRRLIDSASGKTVPFGYAGP